MRVTNIKENKCKQKILITIELSETKCLLQFNLVKKAIDYQQFANSYLRIENPYKYFNLEYRKDKLLDFSKLRMVISQVIDKPMQHVSLEVIQEVLTKFDLIENELNSRLMNLNYLPLNPKFKDQNDLVFQIEEINKQTSQKLKKVNKSWQLLYVVLTTLRQFRDGNDTLIVKLGKTKKEINQYVLKLKKTYKERMEFKALFAQRLYTPQSSLVDTYYHSKLLKLIPNSKIYFQGYEANGIQFQLHYEFYYLTQEFVDNFKELLQKFMEKYQTKYEDESDDSQLTDKNEQKQIDLSENEQKQIDLSEQKQKQLDLSENEQKQLNLGESQQKQIDLSENEQKQLDLGENEQKQIDLGENEQQQLGLGEIEQKQIDLSENQQKQVDLSENEQKQIDLSENQQKQVDLSENEQKQIDLSENQQKQVDLSENEQKQIDLSENQQKLIGLSKNQSKYDELQNNQQDKLQNINKSQSKVYYYSIEDSQQKGLQLDQIDYKSYKQAETHQQAIFNNSQKQVEFQSCTAYIVLQDQLNQQQQSSEPSLSDQELSSDELQDITKEYISLQFYETSTLNFQKNEVLQQINESKVLNDLTFESIKELDEEQSVFQELNETIEQLIQPQNDLIPDIKNRIMSERGKELVREACKQVEGDSLLKGLLYLAQLKREF